MGKTARILTFLVLLSQAGCAAVEPAYARNDERWDTQPAEIRQWFSSVMQPDNPAQSCCGEGDAFEVMLDGDEPNGDLRAVILNGKEWLPAGTVMSVPRSKLQGRYGNPLGKIILFVSQSNGKPLCLIPMVYT